MTDERRSNVMLRKPLITTRRDIALLRRALFHRGSTGA